jgi:DNA-binding response OmpR family regulator
MSICCSKLDRIGNSAGASLPPIHKIAISHASPLNILLIEDEAEAAELIQMYLRDDPREPFLVEWISNLLNGMYRLQHPGVDLVLLDLGLPELNGFDSYHAIDVMTQGKVPIVILTADDRSVSKARALESGASDYLMKQKVTPGQLRAAICAAVGSPLRNTNKDFPDCRH